MGRYIEIKENLDRTTDHQKKKERCEGLLANHSLEACLRDYGGTGNAATAQTARSRQGQGSESNLVALMHITAEDQHISEKPAADVCLLRAVLVIRRAELV